MSFENAEGVLPFIYKLWYSLLEDLILDTFQGSYINQNANLIMQEESILQ